MNMNEIRQGRSIGLVSIKYHYASYLFVIEEHLYEKFIYVLNCFENPTNQTNIYRLFRI